jgi:hypothetical protein
MTSITVVSSVEAHTVVLALAGLQGPPGDGVGIPGPAGTDGADGASAYQVAVAAGFVGTEAQWLASLVGEPGSPGADGADGAAGPGVPVGGAAGQVLAKRSSADFDTEWVAQTGGTGGGATNLSYTASPTGGTVTSDTGADAVLPLVDGANAGLMAPAQSTKLAGLPSTADEAGTAGSAVSAHAAAPDPHPQYALENALGTAAALNAPASGNAAAGEVVKGNDSRLNDARTPTSHTHPASQISDSTATGRAVLTAADPAAARSVIGAGTSNFGGAYVDLTGKPTLGTAAAAATGDFATAAQGTKADSALQPAAIGVSVQAYAPELSSWSTVAPSAKQDTLVSGENIKTVNGSSLLGPGDLVVSGGGGGSPGGSNNQVQFNDGGVFGGDAGLAFNKATGALAVGGKTVATSNPVLDVSQTWNAAGVTFTGIKFNVTNTASAAASLLADFQVGGVSKFSVNKDGFVKAAGLGDSSLNKAFFSGIAFTVSSSGYQAFTTDLNRTLVWNTAYIGFTVDGTSGNTRLYRDADNNLAQRNGTNAQTFRIYGTFTDASNSRRLELSMSTAGVAVIKPDGIGTGASSNVLHISGLPTSNPGPGILWNNAGVVNVGT